ncbi:glycosyltransferase [Rhodococcus pyridinivorans]|uniref:glycosyltransferase n=1 Tax=Rhodococcus pyridinivorans TaxID=103816 RepID=UPI0020C63C9E|nr:glycosyltransferase [Rhodococcus pyridinivorans]UTM36543.1 glycosyltransferase [Rhodococcus pyridinivorans]
MEKKAVRLLQVARCRTAIVVHNPVKGRDEAESQPDIARIRRNATGLIVHDPALKEGLQSYTDVHVAAHPAYFAWADATAAVSQRDQSEKVALFLGSARKDKGFDQLPTIANELDKLGYTLRCAIGRLTPEETSMLNEVQNIDVLSGAEGHISNLAVREAIEGASVLIAPYSNVTASGTVLMAMSAGLPIAAYHNPGLESLIPDGSLARPGTPKNIGMCVIDASNHSADDVLQRVVLHDDKAKKEWTAAIEKVLNGTSGSVGSKNAGRTGRFI